MKRSIIFLFIVFMIPISFPHHSFAIDEEKLWEEFIQSVKTDEFSEDRIRPHFESLRKPNMDFINRMKNEAVWKELEAQPEIIRKNEQINYLVPLTLDSSKATYCFTFTEEKEKWYLRHIEAIFIRLDKIPSLPTSDFPDLPESQKNWQREEIFWSKQIHLFNFLSKEKSKKFAFNWFKDGAGYFLTAKTWVPFVKPKKAFILYLCWEQAKLRGNEVTLEKLDEKEAIVRISPHFIRLYLQTGHLKQQISFEDYVQLFSTIWQDRAEKAGWHLDIIGGGWPITFHFKAESCKIEK